MGEAHQPEEHLLCCLPFPKTPDIEKALAVIRKKHSQIRITCEHTAAFPAKPDDPSPISDDIWRSATIVATLGFLPKPEQAKNIKFIHFFSAGTNHIQKHPIYTDTEIPLTTSSGLHGPAISEWVLMQILSHSHKQKTLLKMQKEHQWRGDSAEFMKTRDAVGMRLGVLGYGSIGRQTAHVCKAMGMDVIAYTASPRPTPESKKDNGYMPPGCGDPEGIIPSAWYSGLDKKSLHNFLSQDIDILLIAVPLTKETLYFLGEEEFKILGAKKNAFICNIARGTIIKQDALIKYCRMKPEEGGLRGAAVDVTDPEPLDKDNELWDVENIAVTPHVSAHSTAYLTRTFEILERNISNLEAGKPFINEVNRKRGY